jgi:hypothetical protein
MVCQFKNGMVCPTATSEAGPRRPRSSANYSDSSTKIVVTNLLTALNGKTYLTILKLAVHALFNIVWYVLLRPLRPELAANFSYLCTKLVTTIYLLHLIST